MKKRHGSGKEAGIVQAYMRKWLGRQRNNDPVSWVLKTQRLRQLDVPRVSFWECGVSSGDSQTAIKARSREEKIWGYSGRGVSNWPSSRNCRGHGREFGRERGEDGSQTGQEEKQKDGDGQLAANRITRQAWSSGDEINKDNVRCEKLSLYRSRA